MAKTSISPSFVPVSKLSTAYVCALFRANQLGDDLFSSSFISGIIKLFNDPGNALISARVYPFAFTAVLPSRSFGDVQKIKIGNYTTNVDGTPLTNNGDLLIIAGTFNMAGHSLGSFLDYRSTFRLFCPFYGWIDLNPADVIGQTLTVKYALDIFAGAANIYVDTNSRTIATASCQIAIDLPIGNSNARDKAMAVINSALGATVSAATGNFAGAAAGALSLASAATENISTASRMGGGYGGFYTPNECFIVRRYPIASIPQGYNAHYGRPLMESRTLSAVSGYTVVDSVHMEGFDRATADEVAEVERLLKAGVIL